MTEITVTKGGNSVTFEIYEEPAGMLFARDIGKPEARIYRVGREAPRTTDHRAPMESYLVVGQIVGSDAHDDARVLAEDIVGSHSGGNAATLDLSNVSGLESETVTFFGEQALQLHYPPAQPDWVSLQMQASIVRDVIGGGSVPSASSSTSGSGPVTLTRGGDSITIVNNLDIERRVGLPSTTSRHDSGSDPYAVEPNRAPMRTWEITGMWNTNAATNQNTLVETILKPQLGYGSLTLDFNGIYGLGSYEVASPFAQSARVSWSAGEEGMVWINALKLLEVDNS